MEKMVLFLAQHLGAKKQVRKVIGVCVEWWVLMLTMFSKNTFFLTKTTEKMSVTHHCLFVLCRFFLQRTLSLMH